MGYKVPGRDLLGIGNPVATNQQLEARIGRLEGVIMQLGAKLDITAQTLLLLINDNTPEGAETEQEAANAEDS